MVIFSASGKLHQVFLTNPLLLTLTKKILKINFGSNLYSCGDERSYAAILRLTDAQQNYCVLWCEVA